MPSQKPLATYDPTVTVSDIALVTKLGESALVGNWFVFLQADWLKRSGMDLLLASSGIGAVTPKPAILFRGKQVTLPGAEITPTPLPQVSLVSLTCDKALYRANRDTVRLLIAAPQQPRAELKLHLHLSHNPYAVYPVTLDEHGLCLWSMQGLPEGEYEALLEGGEADVCRFEVAEYRLAPLNAELSEQQLSGQTLRYALSVTAFGQPYSGPVEVELQEQGKRVGKREKLTCDAEGVCRGAVKLTGVGPYTLNVFAGERTATVALKGSEQERRESLVISELGEVQELSLLPLPEASTCRGMYIAQGGANTEPFIVRRVIGDEVEITARVEADLLRVVVLDPTSTSSTETLHEHLAAQSSVRLPIPQPYGVVLLGAFIDGKAWEGWCAVLRPSDLRLQCEAPQEARPGARITVTLKTGVPDRVVPVQLIVKDQRLIAPSDPQVELAARIKKNLGLWHEQSRTGVIERQLASLAQPPMYMYRHSRGPIGAMAAMPLFSPVAAPAAPGSLNFLQPTSAVPVMAQGISPEKTMFSLDRRAPDGHTGALLGQRTAASIASLAKVRLQFPEIIYNNIVEVQGETGVEIVLGDSMTRYSIEAFALSSETLDWQRAETTLEAAQPVYGELTVSPFVFPGDPVMGRLDVGASTGTVIVEVRHDGEVLPLFLDDGSAVTPGQQLPSGTVVRFPVRPGAFTATVRDARTGEVDASERYVTEPGKLRHIMRRLRILTPGDEATMEEAHVLELRALPGLERPFQFFVEGAAKYPFGCIEQTSTKVVAMYTGYITNQENVEVARDYEAAILVWYKRLRSMYLPHNGFCFYPPEEGGARQPDTHYAPRAVQHLLNLPTAERSGLKQQALRDMLDDIGAMVKDAAAYYKIGSPKQITDCHTAYQVIAHSSSSKEKDKAAAYVRSRLSEHDGQTYVDIPADQPSYRLWGMAVSTREETAYAAAALLAAGEPGDLRGAIAATNYLTGQLNEEGRLYSTIDTAACLALLIELRASGVVTTAEGGRASLNGQEMSLADALAYNGKVESLRCLNGVIAVQVTSEVIEDWSSFKSQLPVEVRLERKQQAQKRFKIGDELELVIRVPRYEPGLIAHVCLPDALARVVGGGQVKRFSLDFCEKNVLRVPLAAVGSTSLPNGKNAEAQRSLLRWLGINGKKTEAADMQHWAVIVRNMFKEEQVGNPGLLEVMVE